MPAETNRYRKKHPREDCKYNRKVQIKKNFFDSIGVDVFEYFNSNTSAERISDRQIKKTLRIYKQKS